MYNPLTRNGGEKRRIWRIGQNANSDPQSDEEKDVEQNSSHIRQRRNAMKEITKWGVFPEFAPSVHSLDSTHEFGGGAC